MRADEGPRHRLQHRPLRQRDPDRGPCATTSGTEVKPQVDEVVFPDGKRLIVLAEGPAGESRLRHRPPELRDERLLHQPGAGADRAVAATTSKYQSKVYVLPKQLDEKVARAAPGQARREADQAHAEAGRVSRRRRRPARSSRSTTGTSPSQSASGTARSTGLRRFCLGCRNPLQRLQSRHVLGGRIPRPEGRAAALEDGCDGPWRWSQRLGPACPRWHKHSRMLW